MASSRRCKHEPNSFCYVCDIFLSAKTVKHIITDTNNFRSAYNAYFGVPVGDQDKSWAPHVVCGGCRSTLEAWYRGESRKMKFGVPNPKPQKTCVFDYPDILSSLRPVAHSEELPVPPPPQQDQRDNCSSESGDDSIDDEDLYEDVETTRQFPNQQDLNDLIRDLGLTKSNAELLTSRLKK